MNEQRSNYTLLSDDDQKVFDKIIALFEKVVGRKATEQEVAEARREFDISGNSGND
jgi:hypothetical protein